MSPDPRPPVSDQTPTPEPGDLGPWCCYADEVGMYADGVCTPEDPRHAPTHCGYDNVRRGLVPAPSSGSPAADERHDFQPVKGHPDDDDPRRGPWPPAPSPSQPEPGGQDGYLAWLRETHDGACRFCGMGNETVDQHAGSCAAMRLLEGWQILGPRPAPPAVPGDRPDPLADLVPLAEDVLDAATDRSGFRNGRLLADAVIDADAQPAHPAPDGDELRNLRRWKSEATTVLDTWDKVHEALGSPGLLGEHKSAASLAEIERRTAAMRQLIDDIAPPGGYGVADGTAK